MIARFASIVFASILISILVGSCCKEKDYIFFEGVSLSSYKKLAYAYEPLNQDSAVSPSDFGLFVGLRASYYSEGFDMDDLFMNKAYATEPCQDGRKGSKESIVSFSITSNADIDSSFVAGRELNNLFRYKQGVFLPGQDGRDTAWKAPDANLLELWRFGFGPILRLNEDHLKDSVHIFSVSMNLSDNRVFHGSTSQVRFK